VENALDLIDRRPASKDAYAALLAVLDGMGPYQLEAKRSSLHFTRGRAFLGVHPRATGLLLNLVTTAPLTSSRVRRAEQISANRCHNEVLVTGSSDIDDELTGWITDAYRLTESTG
jgi:hypothetical protein